MPTSALAPWVPFSWVAADPVPSPGPAEFIDPGTIGPGLVGLLLFLFLGGATFLLWRSMNKQLNRIDFDEGATDLDDGPRPKGGSGAAAPRAPGSATTGRSDVTDPPAPG